MGRLRPVKNRKHHRANKIENRYDAKGLHGLSLHPWWYLDGAAEVHSIIPVETFEKWKARPNVHDIGKSAEQGAATSVLAAVGPGYEGKGRLYLDNCVTAGATEDGDNGYSTYAFEKEKEARLWKDSLTMVGLTDE